jgi:NADH-ubiquinone oxidoreductase chain 5
MGNLFYQIPTASACISLANLALCGFPFIAGFYSKDLIIESAISITNNSPIIILAFISLGLTSFYSIRFSLIVIWGPNLRNSFSNVTEKIEIIIPIALLGLSSIAAGSSILWLTYINIVPYIISTQIKLIPLSIVLTGVIMS